jgi:hypothetical protein
VHLDRGRVVAPEADGVGSSNRVASNGRRACSRGTVPSGDSFVTPRSAANRPSLT